MAIIVGDIHGNVEKVKAFLSYKPGEEHVALGDYVDSFSAPLFDQINCLTLLLESSAILLWGNHDLHYLCEPPFICSGWQDSQLLQKLYETNKHRFIAAYVTEGCWLCTHAGVHQGLITKGSDMVTLAADFNGQVERYLNYPYPMREGIWRVGKSRGGFSGPGGIFWYDFKRESDLADVKQIFGHTETPEPVVTEIYVALDTTNNSQYCWLYDTSLNELVRLDLQNSKTC